MIAKTNIRVTFVTSKENKKALQKRAAKDKRTMSSQIDFIIEAWLKENKTANPNKGGDPATIP